MQDFTNLESGENANAVTRPRCAFLKTFCTRMLAEFIIRMSPWIFPLHYYQMEMSIILINKYHDCANRIFTWVHIFRNTISHIKMMRVHSFSFTSNIGSNKTVYFKRWQRKRPSPSSFSYIARNFPSGDTLKAETGSRETNVELILFHEVGFHFIILPPLSA